MQYLSLRGDLLDLLFLSRDRDRLRLLLFLSRERLLRRLSRERLRLRLLEQISESNQRIKIPSRVSSSTWSIITTTIFCPKKKDLNYVVAAQYHSTLIVCPPISAPFNPLIASSASLSSVNVQCYCANSFTFESHKCKVVLNVTSLKCSILGKQLLWNKLKITLYKQKPPIPSVLQKRKPVLQIKT